MNVCTIPVDYKDFDTSNIINIQRYFMKKHEIIKKKFIR